MLRRPPFFFNDTATTEIYTFPYTTLFRSRIFHNLAKRYGVAGTNGLHGDLLGDAGLHPHPRSPHRALRDRKSTRLNSSHGYISYAVFCLKKKKVEAIKRQTD